MKSRKLISVLLCLCLMVMLLPLSVMAANAAAFSDMPADYSTAALQVAAANGLLKGNDGKILPKANLTRAQMAAVVNRAFGATEKADVSGYTDVPAGAWYADDMAAAVHMKTFQGSGAKLAPQTPITRQEAFAVLARALGMADGSEKTLSAYTDGAAVATWAKGAVSAMVEAGYVHGSGAKLNPTAKMTRADFAVVMDSIVKTYISKAGEYTENTAGTIMVNVPGVTLKNITVSGDLIIGDGVGDGDVILDGVSVTGRTIVRGGGVHSIKVVNNSNLGTVVISKVDGNVRVAADDTSSVSVVVVNDGKDDVVVEGKVTEIKVETGDTPVTVQNATVDKVTVTAENAAVTVANDATVKEVAVEEAATGANVAVAGTVTTVTAAAPDTTVKAAETAKITTVNAAETATNTSVETTKGASVGTVNAAAEGTSVSGEGTVTEANVTANNTSINTAGTKLEVAGTATGTKVGTTTVEAGTSGTTTAAGTVETKPAAPSGGSTPAPDYAAKVEKIRQGSVVETTNYATVEEAITAANASNAVDSEYYRTTMLKSATLGADVTINASATDLTIPAGMTLTVPEGKTLTNNDRVRVNGTVNNTGVLHNNGIIALKGSIANISTIQGEGEYDVFDAANLKTVMPYAKKTVSTYDNIALTEDLVVPTNVTLRAFSTLTVPTGLSLKEDYNVGGNIVLAGGSLEMKSGDAYSKIVAPAGSQTDYSYAANTSVSLQLGRTTPTTETDLETFVSADVFEMRSGELTGHSDISPDLAMHIGSGATLNVNADMKMYGQLFIDGTLNVAEAATLSVFSDKPAGYTGAVMSASRVMFIADGGKANINGSLSVTGSAVGDNSNGIVYVNGTLTVPALSNISSLKPVGESSSYGIIRFTASVENNVAYCGKLMTGNTAYIGDTADFAFQLATRSVTEQSGSGIILYGNLAYTAFGRVTMNRDTADNMLVVNKDATLKINTNCTLSSTRLMINYGTVEIAKDKTLTVTADPYPFVYDTSKPGTFVVYDEANLKTICEYAPSGSIVKLGGDIALTAQQVVNRELTLDLNGHNLTYTGTSYPIKVTGLNASLTIDDSSLGKSGRILSDSTWAVCVFEDATLTVNNGTIQSSQTAESIAISGNGSAGKGGTTININGGTIKGYEGKGGVGIYHPQSGTLNITGGTISGGTALEIKSGAVEIAITGEPVLTATYTSAGSEANNGGTSSSGYALALVENAAYIGNANVSIAGGIFNGPVAHVVDSNNSQYTYTISITGGTFSSSPSEYLASGYTASRDTLTGQYVVSVSKA